MTGGVSYFQYHLTQKFSEKLEEAEAGFNAKMKEDDAPFQNDMKSQMLIPNVQ